MPKNTVSVSLKLPSSLYRGGTKTTEEQAKHGLDALFKLAWGRTTEEVILNAIDDAQAERRRKRRHREILRAA